MVVGFRFVFIERNPNIFAPTGKENQQWIYNRRSWMMSLSLTFSFFVWNSRKSLSSEGCQWFKVHIIFSVLLNLNIGNVLQLIKGCFKYLLKSFCLCRSLWAEQNVDCPVYPDCDDDFKPVWLIWSQLIGPIRHARKRLNWTRLCFSFGFLISLNVCFTFRWFTSTPAGHV